MYTILTKVREAPLGQPKQKKKKKEFLNIIESDLLKGLIRKRVSRKSQYLILREYGQILSFFSLERVLLHVLCPRLGRHRQPSRSEPRPWDICFATYQLVTLTLSKLPSL